MIKSLSYHCPGLFRTFPGRTSRKSVGQFGRRGYCRGIAVPRIRELSRGAPHSRGCPGREIDDVTSAAVAWFFCVCAAAATRHCTSASIGFSNRINALLLLFFCGCGILLVSLDTHSGYRFSLNLAAQLFGGLPRILLVGDSPVFCCCWHAAYTPP